MRQFQFALGAMVVLESSRAAYYQQLEDDAEERRIAALPEEERPQGVATLRARTTVEKGIIIGRAEYANGIHDYRIRYVAADGRQTEDWFQPDAFFEPEVVVAPGDDAAGEGPAREESGIERAARVYREMHPVWAVDIGRRPAELVLFGGGRRTMADTWPHFGSGARVGEAEGFADIYERVYRAERDEEGSTAESAARAANEAVTLFVTIKREEREAGAAAEEAARKAIAGVAKAE